MKAIARAVIPALLVLCWIVYAIVGGNRIVIWAITVVGCVLWGAVLYEPRQPGGGPPPNVPS